MSHRRRLYSVYKKKQYHVTGYETSIEHVGDHAYRGIVALNGEVVWTSQDKPDHAAAERSAKEIARSMKKRMRKVTKVMLK